MKPRLLLALLASVASSVSAARTPTTKTLKGAFIFVFHDGQDPTSFIQSLAQVGTTRYHYNSTFIKGISVQLHDVEHAQEAAVKLAQDPAVDTFHPVRIYSKVDTQFHQIANDPQQGPVPGMMRRHALNSTGLKSPEGGNASGPPDQYTPHVMTQVDQLRALGLTGKGLKVAVIDTGVDYNHPMLGGGFGPGFLVEFGTDLVGDDYNADTNPIPVPDSDPMDCSGHGTHVVGILAAQENRFNFTGVAPGVKVGMYRVIGCEGGVGDDVLIQAYLMAYNDGANIITASIGGIAGWPEEPWTAFVSSIVAAGVPCLLAAGNDGDLGLFTSSAAAEGHGVISVASVDNVVAPAILVTGSNYTIDGGDPVPFAYALGSPTGWAGIDLPLFALPSDDNGCGPLRGDGPDLGDVVVILNSEGCSPFEKLPNIAAKGAKFIMFLSLSLNPNYIDGNEDTPVNLTAVGDVDEQVAAVWMQALQSGKKVTVSMGDPLEGPKVLRMVDNPVTGGFASNFTTWGLTWEMDLKPQFATPGGFIISTFPIKKGSYALASGTSMATPAAAGILALIAEARGTLDPATLQNVLSTTSRPMQYNINGDRQPYLAPAAQQGAGILQAYNAAAATSLLNVSYLTFNDTEHRVASRAFTISNEGDEDVDYEIFHNPTNSFYTFNLDDPLNPAPFPNDNVPLHASLHFSQTKFTIGRGQFATIEVSATDPVGIDASRLAVWSGYIAINGSDCTSLSLTYVGVAGSIREHPPLSATDGAWVSITTDPDQNPVAANTTFSLPGPGNAGPDDVLPDLAVLMSLGTRVLQANVVAQDAATVLAAVQLGLIANETAPANDGSNATDTPRNDAAAPAAPQYIGQLFGFPMLTTPRGLLVTPWDGRLSSGDFAPPGNYRVTFRALAILGDPSNEADWYESQTEMFSIKYQ